MGVLENLKKLCPADNPRLSEPFAGQLDGERYIGASNGWGLLVIRSDEHLDLRAAPFDWTAVIPSKGLKFPADLDAIRAWASEGRTGQTQCPACKGEKIVICRARCWNPETEDVHGKHWTECSACEGKGIHSERPRPGRIGGLIFNRNLIADFTGPVNGGLVEVEVEQHPVDPRVPDQASGVLALRGDGWTVVVMGMRDSKSVPHPEFTELKPIPSEKVG